MLIGDKYRRPYSDAAHYHWRLFRTYDMCPSIRQIFEDDITFAHFFKNNKLHYLRGWTRSACIQRLFFTTFGMSRPGIEPITFGTKTDALPLHHRGPVSIWTLIIIHKLLSQSDKNYHLWINSLPLSMLSQGLSKSLYNMLIYMYMLNRLLNRGLSFLEDNPWPDSKCLWESYCQ